MRLSSVAVVVVCTLLGIAWGVALGGRGHLSLEPTPAMIPAPHNVPKMAGGTALRMAMVHDVVHQRYFLHSAAYYNQRTTDCRKKLGSKFENIAEAPDDLRPTLAEYALLEDLSVGLERTKQYPEAIAIQRKKLKWQADLEQAWLAEKEKLAGKPAPLPLSPEHAALYGTYVNLGTFLMLDSLGPAIGGDPKGKAQLKESIEWVRKAIEINPDSHFGREIWQVVIGEHLLAAVDHPELLTKFDMCGNRLDENLTRGVSLRLPFEPGWVDFCLSKQPAPSASVPWDAWAGEEPSVRENFRKAWITRVGADPEWTKAVPGVPGDPAPFDEPTLAILGMWMLGGGPNPHFSLALGELMARVGEPDLAWKAFERTRRMSAGFWSDKNICEAIDKHCIKRQDELVGEGGYGKLMREFDENLAKGTAYQTAQAEFEAARIQEGIALDDPKFYMPFFAKEGRISSKLGSADYVKTPAWRFSPLRVLPALCFYAGVGSVLGMLIVSLRPKRAV
jgi:hypothetical protein